MPLYEYECTVCSERTEVIQRLSDAPLAECPRCGKPVKKLLSAPSFQFKGSGWYVTDYAGKKSGSASAATDSSEKETSTDKSTSEKKAESAGTKKAEGD